MDTLSRVFHIGPSEGASTVGKLTDDEKKLLAELQEREAAPDVDDDFEIEIYDTKAQRGARIPFSKGKKWLFESFGVGEAPEPAAAEGGAAAGAGDGAAGSEGPKPGTFFGRK